MLHTFVNYIVYFIGVHMWIIDRNKDLCLLKTCYFIPLIFLILPYICIIYIKRYLLIITNVRHIEKKFKDILVKRPEKLFPIFFNTERNRVLNYFGFNYLCINTRWPGRRCSTTVVYNSITTPCIISWNSYEPSSL